MTKIKESGHDINVANFEDLISVLTGFGAGYNPGNNSIIINALQTALTNGQTINATEKINKANWQDLRNTKVLLFLPLPGLSTRILNTFISCNLPEQFVDDLRAYNRKMHGERAIRIKTQENINQDNQNPVKHISVSQRSCDSMMEHLNKIISFLSIQPQYITNEPELKITALQTLLNNLKLANRNAFNAYVILSNTRLERNEILYDRTTGILALARLAKAFVKGKYGADSPEYKQVSAIKFVRIVKKK